MSAKVVVIGGSNGQYPAIFKKLAALHARNSFTLGIIAGDLFADPATATDEDEENITALLEGSLIVPFPTYFSVGRRPLPPRIVDKLLSSSDEVCENLCYVGKRGTLKTSDGIKIVALGGLLDTNITVGASNDQYTPFHTADDAKALRGANSADVLLTSTWPSSIRSGSSVDLPEHAKDELPEQGVADLCASLRPRYHFSTSPSFFYEREPFFHDPSAQRPDVQPVTRFISLASYGNSHKQKWLYAFNLDPSTSSATALPPGTTPSPLLTSSKKRSFASAENQSYSRYSQPGGHHHRAAKRSRQPPPGSDECFFCLSNPNLATHLISSIANDSYLTTARGPLSSASTFPSLPFPSHILIIPLAHSPTLASIPDDAARTSTIEEMTRYRHALQAMLQAKGARSLGAVTWEVSRANGIHAHWQFLPVSADLIRRGLVEAAFRVEAENEKYPAMEAREVQESDGDDFFRVWIWTPSEPLSAESNPPQASDETPAKGAETNQALLLPLDVSIRFDVQFGRRVLAKLLGLERRMDWKESLQAEVEESADVAAFKDAFKPFDFSLD
ncbi:MAG: hypothetical protein M1838_004960 [Thelocarpon superellum]|nr:MAG: hypothetical protein M1838_004960 [Thelocarpon superellum]